MKHTSLRTRLIYPAVAGAAYAGLTMLLSPLSYGPLQFRVAESLCVLPFFFPGTAVGLALGCALANTLSAAGILDVVFGALATLLGGACTAFWGRSWRKTGRLPGIRARILACLMPVLWNAVVVGGVLSLSFTPQAFWSGFLVNGGQVALGELGVLFLLGLPLMKLVPRIISPVAS